jgi:hypothetical protein
MTDVDGTSAGASFRALNFALLLCEHRRMDLTRFELNHGTAILHFSVGVCLFSNTAGVIDETDQIGRAIADRIIDKVPK